MSPVKQAFDVNGRPVPRYMLRDHYIDVPLPDAGLGELDELIAARGDDYLLIPVSPEVVRWLLRGTFVDGSGTRARMIGAHVSGDRLTPYFRSDLP